MKGVFKVEKWYRVPEIDNRFAFEGTRDEVLESIYVNKTKIPDGYKVKGAANPIKYGKNNKYSLMERS